MTNFFFKIKQNFKFLYQQCIRFLYKIWVWILKTQGVQFWFKQRKVGKKNLKKKYKRLKQNFYDYWYKFLQGKEILLVWMRSNFMLMLWCGVIFSFFFNHLIFVCGVKEFFSYWELCGLTVQWGPLHYHGDLALGIARLVRWSPVFILLYFHVHLWQVDWLNMKVRLGYFFKWFLIIWFGFLFFYWCLLVFNTVCLIYLEPFNIQFFVWHWSKSFGNLEIKCQIAHHFPTEKFIHYVHNNLVFCKEFETTQYWTTGNTGSGIRGKGIKSGILDEATDKVIFRVLTEHPKVLQSGEVSFKIIKEILLGVNDSWRILGQEKKVICNDLQEMLPEWLSKYSYGFQKVWCCLQGENLKIVNMENFTNRWWSEISVKFEQDPGAFKFSAKEHTNWSFWGNVKSYFCHILWVTLFSHLIILE